MFSPTTQSYLGAGSSVARGSGERVASTSAGRHTRRQHVVDARTDPAVVPEWTWLIDGFNLLHAVILRGRERSGWWKRSAQEQVLRRLHTFRGPQALIWVVFDASPTSAERYALPEIDGALRVAFAPSADAWIVDFVTAARQPGSVHVVTADRSLADRCRWRGAQLLGPRTFAASYLGDVDPN